MQNLFNKLKLFFIQKPAIWLLGVYFLIRIFSLITYHHPLPNQVVTCFLIILFCFIAFKNFTQAWTILITELLLNGAGHFLEFQGLIIRTWLLGILAITWLIQKIKKQKIEIKLPKPILISLSISGIIIILSILLGIIHEHGLKLVLQDAILYFFLLLFLPALEQEDKINKNFFINLIKTFIIGTAIFSLISFIIYSSHLGNLLDFYYHWFRNIASGKITDLGNNFFRIVLPEQLFIIPLILILTAQLIQNTKNKLAWSLLITLLIILNLNFSRIYFLALAIGSLILIYKNSFKSWIKTMFIIGILTITIFLSLNLIASRFTSLGLELWGIKISAIKTPEADLSGAIRMAMLPDIFNTIKTHPYFGSGLATTVSYPDPLTHEIVSRTQFDWGYLEMIAELGFIGTAIFIGTIGIILYYLFKLTYFKNQSTKNPFLQGLLAGAISLFIINITTPALFQGFGILYFVFILVMIKKYKYN